VLKLYTHQYISHEIMSANYARAVAVSITPLFPVSQVEPPFKYGSPAPAGLKEFEGGFSTSLDSPGVIPLSNEEEQIFQQCEVFVAHWQRASLEAGAVLEKIRDGRLPTAIQHF
jgi:hypothetical protein